MNAQQTPGSAVNLLTWRSVVVNLVRNVANVPQPIPLRGFLRVVVVDQIIVAHIAQFQHLMPHRGASEQRRCRKANLRIQAKYFTALHQLRGFGQILRRQKVQAAQLVIFSEHAPGRALRRSGFHGQLIVGRNFR